MLKIKRAYHNYFFLFGIIYYLIIPVIVYEKDLLYGWNKSLEKYFIDNYITKYFTIILLFLISFYSGSFLVLIKKPKKKYILFKKKYLMSPNYNRTIVKLFFFFCICILLVYRPTLKIEVSDPFIGFISTLLLLIVFFLLYDHIHNIAFRNNKFSIFLLLICIFFLLNSGSRMNFVLIIIMLLLYLKERQIVKSYKLIIVALFIFFFVVFIGIYRLGSTDLKLFGHILWGEPCYTWFSVASFLYYNEDLPLLSFPSNYIYSFVNFIPRFIFPMKTSLVPTIPYDYDAPLGALSVFVSLIGNFGIIGSLIFLFLVGMYSSYIYLHTYKKFVYVYYIAYCSIIPFQFFRDSYTISNKSVFFTFLVIPILVLFITKLHRKQT
jgi:hypothetical protein